MKIVKHLVSLSVILALFGCEPSQAEELYNRAVQMEHGPGGHLSHQTAQAYREVIKAAPNSKWAEKAQKRIDVIHQNISAYWQNRLPSPSHQLPLPPPPSEIFP